MRPEPIGNALADLVALDVVLEMNARIERAVGLLRLVFEVDLGKHQTHRLRCRAAGGAAVHDAGDEDVVHLDDEIFLLALAGLAMGDGRFLQVLTPSRMPSSARETPCRWCERWSGPGRSPCRRRRHCRHRCSPRW